LRQEVNLMGEEVYKQLCETMVRRGGRYPGVDIPEFCEMARVLFTPSASKLNFLQSNSAAISSTNKFQTGFHLSSDFR